MKGWTTDDALATMPAMPARLRDLNDSGSARGDGHPEPSLFTLLVEVVATFVSRKAMVAQ